MKTIKNFLKEEDVGISNKEEYRSAILKKYGLDIEKFVQRLDGGYADNKSPTDFDLNQLIMGIDVEFEHTDDPAISLEIAMDHLAEFPDYYTRLANMEKEAEEYWSRSK